MKRPSQDVAGRPRVHPARSNVAGRSIPRNSNELASVCHVFRDPLPIAIDDAALIEEFREFLTGNEGFDAIELPAPDPIFSERLRRRLWRNFVLSHLSNGGKETH
jgi:hypothetical protein